MHLVPGARSKGHFNVLRGVCQAARRSPASRSSATSSTTTSAGCRRRWRCSTCSIRRPASRSRSSTRPAITDMRTGAVTALGAKHLARKDSRVLGHIGARGTAYWNVRLLDHLFDFDEIRVHSRRPESRNAFARAARARPRQAGHRVADDWESCVRGADIVVEASRLPRAAAAAQDRVDQAGRVRRSLRHDERGRAVADRHHGQDGRRRLGAVPKGGPFGALRAHVDSGQALRANLHAELGQIVAGLQARPRARRRDDPVLASRAVATRYRARPRDAAERPSASASARGCASTERRERWLAARLRRGHTRERPPPTRR